MSITLGFYLYDKWGSMFVWRSITTGKSKDPEGHVYQYNDLEEAINDAGSFIERGRADGAELWVVEMLPKQGDAYPLHVRARVHFESHAKGVRTDRWFRHSSNAPYLHPKIGFRWLRPSRKRRLVR